MTPPTETKALLPGSLAFSPVLCRAFGVCGGLLIQQIHYWCMNRKNMVDGHYWVWNTTKSWADQLGVFDERTIKNNLKTLRTAGIVVTANHNHTAYDRTLWYRLDYPALASAISPFVTDPKSSQLHDPLGNCFTTHSVTTPLTIPKSSSKTTAEISLVEPSALPDENNIHLIEQPPMQKNTGSAAAILAEFSNKGPAQKSPNTSGSLQSIWKHNVPKHNPEVKFIPEFTIAIKGQFGLIAKALGPRADLVTLCVVQNWVGFSKYAAAQTGSTKTPDAPHVGFLLKNAGHAANFYIGQHEKSPKPVSKPIKSGNAKAPVQLVAQKVKAETASVEDVMAWKKSP